MFVPQVIRIIFLLFASLSYFLLGCLIDSIRGLHMFVGSFCGSWIIFLLEKKEGTRNGKLRFRRSSHVPLAVSPQHRQAVHG